MDGGVSHRVDLLRLDDILTPRFSIIEWACFIVLDIGLEVTDSLSPGTRAVAGLFQSFAVRASGFPIVSLSALAPSFQCVCALAVHFAPSTLLTYFDRFLCIIMMYIAVYPVSAFTSCDSAMTHHAVGCTEYPLYERVSSTALCLTGCMLTFSIA